MQNWGFLYQNAQATALATYPGNPETTPETTIVVRDAALAVDRLADGGYQPIEGELLHEGRCRGYSDLLDLYVCWNDRKLRWFDPKTETYPRTFTQESGRAEAEQDRETAARQ